MRSLSSLAILLLLTGTMTACGGEGAGGGDTPWVTQVDSTGDTVRVRITGEIPESLVRTLVPEVEIGVDDGKDEETFGAVISVMPTPDRGFILYDVQAEAVRQYGPTGAFIRNIGQKGGGPGEFGHVNGVAQLPDGRILIWDAIGARINVYSDTGAYQVLWRVPFAGTRARNMLWTDVAGRTYSWAILKVDPTDRTNTTPGVIVYDANGAVIDSIHYPRWRERPPELGAQDSKRGIIATFPFPFWPENVAQVSPLGGIVSGPGDPYVLYFTDRPGARPIRVEREFVPVPVSATERAEERAGPESMARRIDPAWTWTAPDIPRNKPAYGEVTVTRDGRVWVAVSTPAVPIPAAELSPVRAGEHQFTTRTPRVYDVFSPEGRLLGRVAMPRRVYLLNAMGNDVYVTRSDSVEVERVGRYRIEPALPR